MTGADLTVFRINENRNGDKFSGGTFFFLKLQTSFFFFLNRDRHTTANASTATNNTTKTNTYQHKLTHTNTTKHNTHFQHRHRPTSFQVARGLHRYARTVVSCMMRTCSPNREWTEATHTDTPASQSRVFSGNTRRRFESTHGGVFPHAKPHHTTNKQRNTTPHITNRTHNTTTQRTHHNNNDTHTYTHATLTPRIPHTPQHTSHAHNHVK